MNRRDEVDRTWRANSARRPASRPPTMTNSARSAGPRRSAAIAAGSPVTDPVAAPAATAVAERSDLQPPLCHQLMCS